MKKFIIRNWHIVEFTVEAETKAEAIKMSGNPEYGYVAYAVFDESGKDLDAIFVNSEMEEVV
jgi:hypothetical protein